MKPLQVLSVILGLSSLSICAYQIIDGRYSAALLSIIFALVFFFAAYQQNKKNKGKIQ